MLHDRSATWGTPGQDQIAALYLVRFPASRTFRFDLVRLPLPAMAQSWLIARGCPREAIRLLPQLNVPQDQATRELEERLMGDGDTFAHVASYTHDDYPGTPHVTVLLRDLNPDAVVPFRVLREVTDTDAGTYTLREGGFGTYEEARAWWNEHRGDGTVFLPPLDAAIRKKPQPPAAAGPKDASARRPSARGR
ncbi:hypothetical protein [Streptomyces albus]|uniref:hypothetical protein n=1 Tax=Streptomyces albus TaxID=1888 RepID=UPI003F1DA1C2